MASRSIFKPGVLQGPYPEKIIRLPGFLDQALLSAVNQVALKVRHSPKSLQAFVKAVDRSGVALVNLDDEALELHIQQVKARLHLSGFEVEPVSEAFALIREISVRKLSMRHFDVQLIGGWVMLQGMIAEMKTGEGKTLAATLPACAAAMAGVPVHVVTVNDYLVIRDAELMGPIYQTLGLSVGTIIEGMDFDARKAAYACDITYCSNKQLTFDYLKDRLVMGRKTSRLQLQINRLYSAQEIKASKLLLRGLCFAIVDEVDSVLVDESRTPLILSRDKPSLEQLLVYQQALDIAEQFKAGIDFIVNQRNHRIDLTELGMIRVNTMVEPLTGIWSATKRSRELILQALSAQQLFVKDIHYLVKDGKVQIIDEFTGRVMPDRSWEKGLHQMVETKEGCAMSDQRETIARISYQTFFRRYLHLGGMTGTAQEVRKELFSVYHIPVITIPTNKPIQSRQYSTDYYSTVQQKWEAIVQRIEAVHLQGRPVLIGTRSVEASEHLGQLLTMKGLPHRVLNARQDADEASIVELAGSRGCITVATNMAGRGTDIKLAPGVNELGGLHVIVSECHEARRIDRQLFGRCGRQGNAGSYEMKLSLEDEILTKYGVDWLLATVKKMDKNNMPGYGLLAYALFKNTQSRAERHQAAIRAGLFKMDMNLQNILAFSGKSE
jgi:preprotein translocase subunit SecA